MCGEFAVTDTLTVERTKSVAELMLEGRDRHVEGRLDEAAECYRRVVELVPGHSEAWRRLGVVAFTRGDRALARDRLEHAVHSDPLDAAAHRVLGTLYEVEGQLQPAYAAYAKSCSIDPTQEAASIALARTALALGRPIETIAVAQATIARGTCDAGLLRLLGAALALCGDYRRAADALEASLRLEPDPEAFAHLAACHLQCGNVSAAAAAGQRALELDPAHALATLHVGIAHLAAGNFSAALTAFERAVALGCDRARMNLGRLYLLLGDYRQGWPHFGSDDPVRSAQPVHAALPMWSGAAVPDRRLLVWHEQGIGDSIQMARFLRAARDRVGSLTLACPRETADLFRTVDGVDAVVDMHEPVHFGAFDTWLPTGRLPVVFDVTPQTIPSEPYVRADPVRVERYRSRLAVPGLRVGLVWSGNPKLSRDGARSCGLRQLERLGNVSGITWFALQQGPARADEPTNGMRLIPINAAVTDYADTAAIIDGLDLVITVDTSVANLAGALGRPAWVLLPKTPDWRWGLAGTTTPWYPSLRLFRARTNEWAPLVAEMAAELRRLIR